MTDKHQKPITYLQLQLSSEGITPVTWAAARERLEKAER